mgnify:CR=1 FL=1
MRSALGLGAPQRALGAPWFSQFRPISMDWPRKDTHAREYPKLVTVRPRNPGFLDLDTDVVENTLGDLGRDKRRGRGIGWPDVSPEKLWRTDPTKRPIEVWGIISPGGEDAILAVAKGYRTSFTNRAADDRCTIRGGLAILHALGRSKTSPKGLLSQLVQGPLRDKELVRAAGGGRDIKSAAEHIRRRINALGTRIQRAAWGARGLYFLENLKGFNIVRGAATGVSALFGPVGLVVSGALAIHGGVIGANAKFAAERFARWAKEGMKSRGGEPRGQDRALPGGAPTRQGPVGPDPDAMAPPPPRKKKKGKGRKRGKGEERDHDDPDPGSTFEPGKAGMPIGYVVAGIGGLVLLGALFIGAGRRRAPEVIEREAPRARPADARAVA